MKNKTKLFMNITFIVGAFLTIFSVCFFNFIVDPYFIFRNRDHMDLTLISKEYYQAMLKAYKNNHADTVFIGSSSAGMLFLWWHYYKYYFNLIGLHYFSYNKQYYVLKDYLHFHPETKKVYIVLCYPSMFKKDDIPLPELKENYLNLKELIFLLLSQKTTKKSIEILKDGKRISFKEKCLGEENPTFNFRHLPYIVYVPSDDLETQKKAIKSNIEYFKKMIDLLKEKNIKYQIIIVPYHAIYQAMLLKNPYMQQTVDDLKRLCVELSDEDVYDFSVINKYTTSDYFKKNYLYTDFVHPNYIIGMKIFKLLHDNDDSEKNFYVKLNKKNIESQIKHHKQTIREYIKTHKDIVDKYDLDYYAKNRVDASFVEIRNFDGAPDYVEQEIDLYRKKFKKIHELSRRGIDIEKGVWANKI